MCGVVSQINYLGPLFRLQDTYKSVRSVLNGKCILTQLVKNRISVSVLNRPKQPYCTSEINALKCPNNNHLLDFVSQEAITKEHIFYFKRVNMLFKKAIAGKTQSVRDNLLFTDILSSQTWIDEFINQQRNIMLKEKLRLYILENFLFTDVQSELNDDDSFMEKAIFDSTGILEVIEFLEAECHIKIYDEEMTPGNLDSVNKIIRFVEEKQV